MNTNGRRFTAHHRSAPRAAPSRSARTPRRAALATPGGRPRASRTCRGEPTGGAGVGAGHLLELVPPGRADALEPGGVELGDRGNRGVGTLLGCQDGVAVEGHLLTAFDPPATACAESQASMSARRYRMIRPPPRRRNGIWPRCRSARSVPIGIWDSCESLASVSRSSPPHVVVSVALG